MYVTIGLVLHTNTVSQYAEKAQDQNEKRYFKNLKISTVLNNMIKRIVKSVGDFSVALLEVFWAVGYFVYEIVYFLFLWPYTLHKMKKTVSDYRAKQK